MSLKDDIKALKALVKPKTQLKFVFTESEILDESGTIYIFYTSQAKA